MMTTPANATDMEAACAPAIVVREALRDDAGLIADLTRSAWIDKAAPSSSGHLESLEQVLIDLEQGGGFILLREDRPAGSVRWTPTDADPCIWEIRRMGVLPAFRGERLSQHLLEAVIHRAQAADIDELRLVLRSDQSRLIDLYAAYGFELAPELDFAGSQGNAPAIMRRLLKK